MVVFQFIAMSFIFKKYNEKGVFIKIPFGKNNNSLNVVFILKHNMFVFINNGFVFFKVIR